VRADWLSFENPTASQGVLCLRRSLCGLQCLLDAQRWVKQLQGALLVCNSVLLALAGRMKGRLCVPYLACRLCIGQVCERQYVCRPATGGVFCCQLLLFVPLWHVVPACSRQSCRESLTIIPSRVCVGVSVAAHVMLQNT
jgi:hypothetical protein